MSGATFPRTPLVGRRRELQEVAGLFASGERLVTILGPPGAGKTRFARELARVEDGAGTLLGVAELAETRSAAELGRRIADVLGVPLVGLEEADEQQLGHALAARGQGLLVLDNAEYLEPEARSLIDRLLEQAPLARFLVTSLAPIRVEGEVRYELPPLSLDEAATLYLEQARRVDAAAPLEREAVEALVHQLDRNPLAIQLAAARVRTLRPKHLLARIDQRLSLLQGGPPGRHESLVRALRCSWELLAPWEASTLAQLAIFAGGFDLEAAEAVVDLAGHPGAPPLLAIVDELRNRVLIGADDADPPRFSLLESVRAFARRELERSGLLAKTAERHAAHYLGLAYLEPGSIHDTEQLHRLRPEEENLRAVIRHFETRDPALAARAALALASLFEGRGYGACTPLLETARTHAVAAGDPALLAAALCALGRARYNRGELVEARPLLRESIRLAREAGATTLLCLATLDLAHGEATGEAPREAIPLVAEAAPLARALGHLRFQGRAEQILSMVADQTGRWDDCAAHLERAIQWYRRCGALDAEAKALTNLGNRHAALGESDLARQFLERARELARQAEDPLAESVAVIDLGNLALVDGRLDEAEELLQVARAKERSFGRPRFEALASGNLATVAFERGHFREARQLVADALITFRATGNPFMNGAFSAVQGAILAASGDVALAEREFAISRRCLEDTGDVELLRMHEVLSGFVDLARAREADGDGEAHREAARRKLAAGREGRPGGARKIVARILARALEGWTEIRPEPAPEAPVADAEALVVGPEASWFQLGGAPRVELRRRRAIQRVFHALVEQRLLSPGLGLEALQLFDAGWPDDRASPDAASMRVYHAIKTLRQAGLKGSLLRRGDGYLLDPALPVTRRPS